MTFARIAGTGSYLPENIVTNQDLEKMVDTTDQWIRERTGIGNLKVGYNRAARMVEAMEEQGMIGPQVGSRGREVFLRQPDFDGPDG